MSIDYLVVGATARDLVLHYGYDLEIQRATQDLDFAIEVGDWSAYQTLRESLMAIGFEATREKQGLKSPSGFHVDIVPFGNVANEAGVVAWPPDHEIEMCVLGFPEARAHADIVRLQDTPPLLDVPWSHPWVSRF